MRSQSSLEKKDHTFQLENCDNNWEYFKNKYEKLISDKDFPEKLKQESHQLLKKLSGMIQSQKPQTPRIGSPRESRLGRINTPRTPRAPEKLTHQHLEQLVKDLQTRMRFQDDVIAKNKEEKRTLVQSNKELKTKIQEMKVKLNKIEKTKEESRRKYDDECKYSRKELERRIAAHVSTLLENIEKSWVEIHTNEQREKSNAVSRIQLYKNDIETKKKEITSAREEVKTYVRTIELERKENEKFCNIIKVHEEHIKMLEKKIQSLFKKSEEDRQVITQLRMNEIKREGELNEIRKLYEIGERQKEAMKEEVINQKNQNAEINMKFKEFQSESLAKERSYVQQIYHLKQEVNEKDTIIFGMKNHVECRSSEAKQKGKDDAKGGSPTKNQHLSSSLSPRRTLDFSNHTPEFQNPNEEKNNPTEQVNRNGRENSLDTSE